MNKRRLIFWISFVLIISIAIVAFWKVKDPLHTHPWFTTSWTRHNIELLKHPHPSVAYDAWLKVQNMFFTKWSAYFLIVDMIDDKDPLLSESVNLLIVRESVPVPGKPADKTFMAQAKPVYYKTDQVYCRTVGDVLLALLYRDKKWTQDYAGNWQAWWEANKRNYVTR